MCPSAAASTRGLRAAGATSTLGNDLTERDQAAKLVGLAEAAAEIWRQGEWQRARGVSRVAARANGSSSESAIKLSAHPSL
jgi:hypothetical protein